MTNRRKIPRSSGLPSRRRRICSAKWTSPWAFANPKAGLHRPKGAPKRAAVPASQSSRRLDATRQPNQSSHRLDATRQANQSSRRLDATRQQRAASGAPNRPRRTLKSPRLQRLRPHWIQRLWPRIPACPPRRLAAGQRRRSRLIKANQDIFSMPFGMNTSRNVLSLDMFGRILTLPPLMETNPSP